MAQRNHYEVLGVAPSATPGEIKRAYRRLALKCHPDCNPGKDTTALFKEINAAHECLKDPLRRAAYDRAHPQSARPSSQQAPPKPEPPKQEPPKQEPPKSDPKPQSASKQEKRNAEHMHPHPRRPARAAPPYPLFGLALLVLAGWWWFDPGYSRVEAAASVTAERAAKPPAPPPASPSRASPERSEDPARQEELRREREERETAERARRAEQERRAELRRQEELRREAEQREKIEADRIRAEQERLAAEERAKQDEALRAAAEQQKQEQDNRRAAQMADWSATSARLFGAPYQGGSPCDLPLLKFSRCSDVRANPPHRLTFHIGNDPREPLEVRVSTAAWSLIARRSDIYKEWDGQRAALVQAEAYFGSRSAKRTVLAAFGFSSEMLRICETAASHVFPGAIIEYRCNKQRDERARSWVTAYSVRLKPAAVAAGCSSHPLCRQAR
jgi:curved DNA-binding protein CbpA